MRVRTVPRGRRAAAHAGVNMIIRSAMTACRDMTRGSMMMRPAMPISAASLSRVILSVRPMHTRIRDRCRRMCAAAAAAGAVRHRLLRCLLQSAVCSCCCCTDEVPLPAVRHRNVSWLENIACTGSVLIKSEIPVLLDTVRGFCCGIRAFQVCLRGSSAAM